MLGLAHATERARIHFRSVARTRARGQNRNAPREGFRANLAAPDRCQSWRRARRVTVAYVAGHRSSAINARRRAHNSRPFANSLIQESAVLSHQSPFKKGAPWSE